MIYLADLRRTVLTCARSVLVIVRSVFRSVMKIFGFDVGWCACTRRVCMG